MSEVIWKDPLPNEQQVGKPHRDGMVICLKGGRNITVTNKKEADGIASNSLDLDTVLNGRVRLFGDGGIDPDDALTIPEQLVPGRDGHLDGFRHGAPSCRGLLG